MSEIQLKATNVENKPVRIGDLPIIKTNILENAGQMDKGVVGGYNGTFPLTAASQGGIYLLPSTGKFYVCETAYNGAQISAPNSNFVELSVWKNHDRLNNLITSEIISSSSYSDSLGIREFQFDGNFHNVISILMPDMQGYGRQEYSVITSSKDYILTGFNLDDTHPNPTNLKIEIIRLKKS